MRRLAPLLLLLPLAACAAANPWSNPLVPKEQWDRDYSYCRGQADRDVGYREDDDRASPFKDYDAGQARKRFNALVRACMLERGYVAVKKGN